MEGTTFLTPDQARSRITTGKVLWVRHITSQGFRFRKCQYRGQKSRSAHHVVVYDLDKSAPRIIDMRKVLHVSEVPGNVTGKPRRSREQILKGLKAKVKARGRKKRTYAVAKAEMDELFY